MPTLLDRLPFLDAPTELLVRGEPVRLRANQLILWFSLTARRLDSPNPAAVPFPVILDTGHTHTLSLHERHLREWAGLRPDALAPIGAVRDRGERILLREANVWLHPNRPGVSRPDDERTPHPIAAKAGIAVYPGDDFPRLPILGLRAIAENDLLLTVDGRRRTATLRTARRWWPF